MSSASVPPPLRERPIGYAALIARFSLPDLGLAHASYLRASGAMLEEKHPDGSLRVGYPRGYDPGDGTLDHLVFALKYDGIDLRVLRGVFAAMPEAELRDAIRAQPTGQYTRRLWFLYEWLTGRALDVPDLTQGNYVPLFDPEAYVTGPTTNSPRHRVRQNALGPDAALCPVLRRTPRLAQQIDATPALEARATTFLDTVPSATLWRATAYLYDKETRSSYAIERETPKGGRVERFVRVLREALDARPMSRELLVRVQNAIVEPDYAESHARRGQNWVGRTGPSFLEEVHLLPPTPEALPALLDAWIALANHLTRRDDNPVPPIVGAAVLSFLFVYLHPFFDGNGRTHRWLLHWALARRGFGPRGVVLPVSAAILRDADRYEAVLASRSLPMLAHVRYEFRGHELVVLDDHVGLFRHLDLTAHAEALFDWLTRTIDREMREEVEFLERFDRAVAAMRATREMPDRKEQLFVRYVAQNRGQLSANKRGQFAEVPDDELAAMEAAVRDAFDLPHP